MDGSESTIKVIGSVDPAAGLMIAKYDADGYAVLEAGTPKEGSAIEEYTISSDVTTTPTAGDYRIKSAAGTLTIQTAVAANWTSPTTANKSYKTDDKIFYGFDPDGTTAPTAGNVPVVLADAAYGVDAFATSQNIVVVYQMDGNTVTPYIQAIYSFT